METNINNAVEWAQKKLIKPPSKETINQYMKILNRLWPKVRQGYIPGTNDNRNTRSVERSAFRFGAAIYIKQNQNPKAACAVFSVVQKIQEAADEAQLKYSKREKFKNVQKKKSKRPSLRGVGPKFREELIGISSQSKYADAIRVMAICGCRPSEMENGVILKRQINTITIEIKGAKCSSRTSGGQSSRILTFDSNHPLIGSIREGTYQAKAHAIGDAISHFGKTIGKNKNNPISAYSLRHAVASDFKASNLSKEEIAAALGHRSTATMSFYGTNRRSSGMLALLSVTAASPVRTYRKKSKKKISNI